jgi:hypothetical protein
MRKSDLAQNALQRWNHAVMFESLDFIAKLAALVPKPRVNLRRLARTIPDTRPLRGPAKAVQIHSRWICHGVFAPYSKYRVNVMPAKRGKGRSRPEGEEKKHQNNTTWP